ncbi:helix-turn-helix transcriptional regulator [Flavihumibacter sp. ZG627]|uniref:helix-turn-helix domain-containing protein n=1 Tax=Flavihumibacter sp. ZG627 TaxID=1463156 RepID=UPI0012E08A3E|nr:helix-turn-helix transcriptional regulator [Flavihumibacter sp. ZG627]
MNSENLVIYIRDAKFFNLRQLELAAGIPPSTLSKAISGARLLPDNAARKVLHVFKVCGVTPSPPTS